VSQIRSGGRRGGVEWHDDGGDREEGGGRAGMQAVTRRDGGVEIRVGGFGGDSSSTVVEEVDGGRGWTYGGLAVPTGGVASGAGGGGAGRRGVEEDEEEGWGRARRAVGSREEEEIDVGSSWSRGRRNRGVAWYPYRMTRHAIGGVIFIHTP
jgi:hypothetical protein